MDRINVLVVEDDPNLGQILSDYLRLKKYNPTLCTDGEAGLEKFKNHDFDICLLDIMMPRMDGFALAREIRNLNKEIPIIFLTAKSMKEDAIEGFKLGADDYITKPFSMEELLLRINAVLRRSFKDRDHQKNIFLFGNSSLDSDKQLLSIRNEKIKLTNKESQLLKLLCQNKNEILDRSAALKMIWHDDSYFNARSMDVYITKLRKYLKKDASVSIQTIHGEGFKLIDQS
ncbi:MAG: response regulator transcription factor [Cyclobacteriaceae bacterium]|nr:response regulator transcription factor [Cyclobacteriaceae bacterium]